MEAHPQLKGVSAAGASVLPTRVIEEAFRHQYDKTLNAGEFQSAIAKLDSWYADRGIFGQVLSHSYMSYYCHYPVSGFAVKQTCS